MSARAPYGGRDDVMAIASHFVQDYYDKFASSFPILQTMYGKSAKLLVTGNASPGNPHTYDGQKEITTHFEALGQYFGDSRKVCIQAVDAVVANMGAVVVTVAGSIYTPTTDTSFTSVFVLQSNAQYNTDSFHIFSEVLSFNEETKNTPPKPAPVQQVPAQQAPVGVPAPRSHAPVAAPAAAAPAPKKVFEEDDVERGATPPPQKKEQAPRERKERKPREEKPAAVEAKKEEKAAAPAPKEDKPRERKERKPREEKEEKPAAAPKPPKETKPNRFVVLRNVPKKTTQEDVQYYASPFGAIKSTEWLGKDQKHAVVEFKYLADAEAICVYEGFTMFKKPVRVEFYIPKPAKAEKEGAAAAAPAAEKTEAPKASASPKEDKEAAPAKEKRERKPAGEKKPAPEKKDEEKAAPTADKEDKKERKPRGEKKDADAAPAAEKKAPAAKPAKADDKKAEKKPAAAKKTDKTEAPKAEASKEEKKTWTGWNKTPAGPPAAKKA